MLYKFGVVVHRVNPNGSVHNFEPVVVNYAMFDVIKDRETFESIPNPKHN